MRKVYTRSNIIQLFHDLIRPAVSHYSDWGMITAHNLIPVKRDDWNASRVCLSHARARRNASSITAVK